MGVDDKFWLKTNTILLYPLKKKNFPSNEMDIRKVFFLLLCTDHNKKKHNVFKQLVKFLFGFNPKFKIKPELFSTKLVYFGDTFEMK